MTMPWAETASRLANDSDRGDDRKYTMLVYIGTNDTENQNSIAALNENIGV